MRSQNHSVEDAAPASIVYLSHLLAVAYVTPVWVKIFLKTPSPTHCNMCPEEMWGNNPLVGSDSCVQLNESYLEFVDPWSIIIAIIASFGLISVAVTCVVFGIYGDLQL